MAATTPRRRDATKTRQLLLEAALQRFTRDGYAATTVRDIADDAGVNVALISRYFKSKEGLFEACLTSSVDEIRRTTGDTPLSRTPEAIARQIAGPCTEGLPHHLVLLLRSSGDEAADRIRLDLLRSYGQRLAVAAGWPEDDETMLLRAQIVLAAATGIALLRTKSGLEPLASATAEDLVAPLRDLVDALMSKP
ncbi:TetR family transcriptional regulator [Actinoplanes philippinensis]|uniref:DNA-binding transcriptional regulator, AcrR family n=1 Tax=Actinoplanes philippinensis TaxID=35752 RepID=A0A1I2AD57_9ACTN|nr:TetR/AcrR family transcriptional regulator [Actinoplanes philippinensis]GIE74947.1 TetR family transcriptional regulator [Actinoplanes philippinensis]SFE41812.1 DNA-binding transcriptional regulator, AcrR family [Actinoplanes philippinensis]